MSNSKLGTVKPALRDYCNEKPPVLKDHIFQAENETFEGI